MTKDISKRDHILEAALRIVTKNNNFKLTIREVAKEANVNVAAINYYFNNKDHLLVEMEKLFYENFKDAFTPLEDKNTSGEEKLINWFDKAIDYATKYPGMLVYLRSKFNDESADEKDIQMKLDLISYLANLYDLFKGVINQTENVQELFMAFSSAIIFPFTVGTFLQGMGLEKEKDERKNYIRLILKKFKSEVK